MDPSFSNADTLEREIGLAISHLHGFRTALFVPEQAFDKIVQILLEQYKSPVVSCVRHIRKILDDIMDESLTALAKYPELKKQVVSLVTSELNRNESNTNQQLATHIEAQKSFMNTKHPDFLALRATGHAKSPDTEKEDIEHVSSPGDTFKYCQIFFLYNLFLEFPDSRLSNNSGSGSKFFLSTGEEAKEKEFTGRLRIAQGRHSREAVCTITKNTFSFVISPRHFLAVEVKESFSLQQVDCYSKAAGSGERLFILQREDRKVLVRDQVRLEMMASREESEDWAHAFKAAGILKEIPADLGKVTLTTPDSPKSKPRGNNVLKSFRSRETQKENSVTEQILKDKELQDQSKIIKKMIEDYMKITDKTIRDVVPKYIILSLVKATQIYVKKDLVGDVLKDVHSEEERKNLIQANQDYEETIAELLKLRQATQNALDVFVKLF